MEKLFLLLLQILLTFLYGSATAKLKMERMQAEKAAKGHEEGDKIDAAPDLPRTGDGSVFNWFKRLRK